MVVLGKMFIGMGKDQLTSNNGYTIEYDALGNPTNYLANNIDVSFSWNGRQMIGMNHPYGGWYSYEYNDEGLLTKKTGEGMTTEFIYDGTRLISVKQTYYTIIYLYDDGMTPMGMLYRSSTGTEWITYWFERNLQGDIVATYSADGIKLRSYTYDAFGNMTSKHHATDTAGGLNYHYMGYRGYCMDPDLGLYFTQTRLYDPTTGRFISADSYVSTGQGLIGNNMYVYCLNNPVNMVDYSGEFGWLIALVVVGVAALTLSSCNSDSTPEENHSITDDLHLYYVGEDQPIEGKINVAFSPGKDNPSFQIENSYKITNKADQRAILEYIMASSYYSQEIYQRTLDSMMREWDAHNRIYSWTRHPRVAHTDFDKNDEKVGYIGFYWRAFIAGITGEA